MYSELFDNILGNIIQDVIVDDKEAISTFMRNTEPFIIFYLEVRDTLNDIVGE